MLCLMSSVIGVRRHMNNIEGLLLSLKRLRLMKNKMLNQVKHKVHLLL